MATPILQNNLQLPTPSGSVTVMGMPRQEGKASLFSPIAVGRWLSGDTSDNLPHPLERVAQKVRALEIPLQSLLENSGEESTVASEGLVSSAQGVARGVVTPAIGIPFSTREHQLMHTPAGQPKPPLRNSFNNYGKQWGVQAPNKIIGSMVFMWALSPAHAMIREATDSSFVQKTAPYAIASFAEAGVSSPITTIQQQLRLKKTVTIAGIIKEIRATEGVRGFYRGIAPHAIATAFYNMVIFPMSAEILQFAKSHSEEGQLSECRQLGISFLAGSASSTIALPFLKPIYQVIFQQKQQRTGTDNPPQHFFRTAQTVVKTGMCRTEGPLLGIVCEMYKGSGAACIRVPIVGGTVIAVNRAVELYFGKE